MQGVVILAGAPDAPEAYNRKTFYQDALRGIVTNWSNCSSGLEASFFGKPYCEYASFPFQYYKFRFPTVLG